MILPFDGQDALTGQRIIKTENGRPASHSIWSIQLMLLDKTVARLQSQGIDPQTIITNKKFPSLSCTWANTLNLGPEYTPGGGGLLIKGIGGMSNAS